ncbi:MAG: NAD(P)H-dependent oxidoreductase [Pirellulales bacterium]
MAVAAPQDLLAQLHWRYAVKAFDPARTIDAPTWDALERSLVLTPSSYGLQPWRFIVVTDPAVKAQLPAISWNQSQVRDASHVVVFAAKIDPGEPEVERHVLRTAEVRGVPADSLGGFRKMMLGSLKQSPDYFNHNHWAACQVYIALGQFMLACAMLGVDSCPMEGIQPAKYDELLKLRDEGYRTVVAAAAGYRQADDKYSSHMKVRFPHDEVVRRV